MSAPAPRQSRAGGFTLVELMLVVAIIGILSAIAIPSFSRYVKKSRTSEAFGTLSRMWIGAVSYYEADHAAADGTVLPKQFPNTTSCTSYYNGCCGFPGEVCPGNLSLYSTQGICTRFVELNLNMNEPHRYAPRDWFVTTDQDVYFQVQGDLDCDGIMAMFELKGTANAKGWGDSSGGRVDPHRTGPPYGINELE